MNNEIDIPTTINNKLGEKIYLRISAASLLSFLDNLGNSKEATAPGIILVNISALPFAILKKATSALVKYKAVNKFVPYILI